MSGDGGALGGGRGENGCGEEGGVAPVETCRKPRKRRIFFIEGWL